MKRVKTWLLRVLRKRLMTLKMKMKKKNEDDDDDDEDEDLTFIADEIIKLL